MDAITLLTQKGVKKIEAREQLVSAIADDSFSLGEFKSRVGELNDKQIATFLEAVEAVTGKKLKKLSADYLRFAEQYILSDNNSCKREASRIVGNMAAVYPDELKAAIPALLTNTTDSGTVVRWGSAYARENHRAGALPKQRAGSDGQGDLRSRGGKRRKESIQKSAQET